jgi:Acetyltransferase (GNAT) domain
MIETERLVLRVLEAEDVPAFAAYRRDPDVARYQSWDTTYTTADGERLVAAQQDVEFGEPGPWVQVAAVDRATGELCGDCAARLASSRPNGSRASGPRCAPTRRCAASGPLNQKAPLARGFRPSAVGCHHHRRRIAGAGFEPATFGL